MSQADDRTEREPTIADLVGLSQRFVVPLRLSERCSRCWMQDHCHSDRCPCVCADWEAE